MNFTPFYSPLSKFSLLYFISYYRHSQCALATTTGGLIRHGRNRLGRIENTSKYKNYDQTCGCERVNIYIYIRVDARSLSGVRQISLHVHWYAFVVHVIGNL